MGASPFLFCERTQPVPPVHPVSVTSCTPADSTSLYCVERCQERRGLLWPANGKWCWATAASSGTAHSGRQTLLFCSLSSTLRVLKALNIDSVHIFSCINVQSFSPLSPTWYLAAISACLLVGSPSKHGNVQPRFYRSNKSSRAPLSSAANISFPNATPTQRLFVRISVISGINIYISEEATTAISVCTPQEITHTNTYKSSLTVLVWFSPPPLSVSHGHTGAVAPRRLLSVGLPVTERQPRWEERLTWWPGRVDGKRGAVPRPPAPAAARRGAHTGGLVRL